MRKPTRTAKVTAAVILTAGALIAAVTVPAVNERAAHDPTVATKTATHTNARTFTIAASGDIMAHPPTWQQAQANYTKATGKHGGYDFTPMFRDIKGAISSADLGICHLETPLGDGPPQDFPQFRTPTQMAAAIKTAGYDACSTASNHALDQGEQGVYSTLRALDTAGLGHTGTYATPQDSLTPTVYTTAAGVRVGHLSYTMHFNENRGHHRPEGKEWIANRIDPAAIALAAARTRKAGAQIVVLSIHWGTEHDNIPDDAQLHWAKQIIAVPDIDLVLGHHAHVVQPFEKVGDKWIAFGLGNTLARHDFPDDNNRAGVIARFTFTQQPDGRWKTTGAEAIPIWLALRPEVYVVNVAATLARISAVDDRRRIYEQAHARVTKALTARGADKAGLVVD